MCGMKIERRTFLGAAIAAAVLTGACGTRGATAAKREGDGQTEEFPYLGSCKFLVEAHLLQPSR